LCHDKDEWLARDITERETSKKIYFFQRKSLSGLKRGGNQLEVRKRKKKGGEGGQSGSSDIPGSEKRVLIYKDQTTKKKVIWGEIPGINCYKMVFSSFSGAGMNLGKKGEGACEGRTSLVKEKPDSRQKKCRTLLSREKTTITGKEI